MKRTPTLTLKSKIRLALFFASLFPFVTMLLYLHHIGEERLLDNTLTTQKAQMRIVKATAQRSLDTLYSRLRFLAGLEVMNDIVTQDIDKRILNVLVQLKKDTPFHIDLFALDHDGHVIASTRRTFHEVTLHRIATHRKSIRIEHGTLYMKAPIVTELTDAKRSGTLLLAFPLENLMRFSTTQEGVWLYFDFPDQMLLIGKKGDRLPKSLVIKPPEELVTSERIYLSQPFEGTLKGGYLLYTIATSQALEILDDFVRLVWGLFFLGIFVIALFSWWIGEEIIKPVERLSTAMRDILKTQRYDTPVSVTSEGEIRRLADSFNALMTKVDDSLKRLEKESRVRLERFVNLTDMFTRLVRTPTKEECIETAVNELNGFLPTYRFRFVHACNTSDGVYRMPLFVRDVRRDTTVCFGTILIEGDTNPDEQETRFFEATREMVTLQLDHIVLIDEIRSVSEAKSAFISHMSHELRTPLHTILSTTQYLLAYEHLDPTLIERIATVETSAGYLLGMINDMLDLARIEAGRIEIDTVDISCEELDTILEETAAMIAPLAEQQETHLKRETCECCGGVSMDMKALKQIVINLLSNAVKFTPQGNVILWCRETDDRVEVVIEDDGIGIDADRIEKLFEPFTRLESDTAFKGTGLGLVISRKLARLCNGDVLIESKGRGRGVRAVLRMKRSGR